MAKMTIDIDAKLLAKAVNLTGAKTKKEAVHAALQEIVGRRAQDRLVDAIVAGKLKPLRWTYEEFMAWRHAPNEKIERIKALAAGKGEESEPPH